MSYRAYAVIGIPVDTGKFYASADKVKAFDHDYPLEMKFCPQTGKPLWEENEQPIEGWKPDEGTFLGFEIYQGTEGNPEILAVLGSTDTEGYGDHKPSSKLDDQDLENLKAMKEEIKAGLEPLGMWDESKWGLHAILCYM